MAYTYIEAISAGFPLVFCHSTGDGSVYEDIVWDGGAALPSKAELDSWIAANPDPANQMVLTKYQFRKLFTFMERVTFDSIQNNTNISAQYRAMVITLMKDLELSGVVELYNPDVIAGIQFLEQIGLLASGRAAQILANTPPT